MQYIARVGRAEDAEGFRYVCGVHSTELTYDISAANKYETWEYAAEVASFFTFGHPALAPSNTFSFEIPNLDDVECDPSEYIEAAIVLDTLAAYMRQKGYARLNRERGRIHEANTHEHECERLYNNLPDWARW